MKDKYFLVNNYLPCICNCHEACLRKDLINRGYYIFSMKQISEKEFYKQVEKLTKQGHLKFDLKYL